MNIASQQEKDDTSRVTIILPTYNRQKFLPNAIQCIRSQSYKQWKLIIIDDGSTDGTQALAENYQRQNLNKIQYFKQENQGPGVARQNALKYVDTKYVAFFDSDDLWVQNHLEKCISAFEIHNDLDVVFGAMQKINYEDQIPINKTNFNEDFLNLSIDYDEKLNLNKITDSNVAAFAMQSYFPCTFPGSVFKSEVFDANKIPPFNVAEDLVFIIRLLAQGFKFAYYNNIHLLYQVHNQNTSIPAPENIKIQKLIRHWEQHFDAFLSLQKENVLTPELMKLLKKSVAKKMFWEFSYNMILENDPENAFRFFRKAIGLDPLNLSFRKTYLMSKLKHRFRK